MVTNLPTLAKNGSGEMTHDELLAKIALHWIYADDPEFYGIGGYRKALRAVVELHKPELIESGKDSIFVCSTCNPQWFWENPYPCATIQAIERELE